MSESYYSNKKHQEEISHIVYNFKNHSNQISGVLEYSEEVKELEPHEESGNRKYGSDCFCTYHKFRARLINKFLAYYVNKFQSHNSINTNWSGKIDEIPYR